MILALIGDFWSLLAAGPAAAAVAITSVAGFTWLQSRARARRRQAALDRYAEREIARAER